MMQVLFRSKNVQLTSGEIRFGSFTNFFFRKPLKKRIHRHIADIMAFHDQAHGLRTSRRTFACSGLLLRFFFVQGQTSSFMCCKYGKEWMDSIRFSLFVLLRWLGESFLRYSLKGYYTA